METYLKTRDNINIYYIKDIPKSPKAIVVIVHGFAEHLKRYEYIKQKLFDSDFGIYRFDLRGHGRSGGDRGHVESFMDFILGTDEIVNMVKKEHPNLPIFMLGHSMGGFITFCYGLKYKEKLKGQILSGAAIRKVPQVEGIKGGIVQFLNFFIPKKRVAHNLSGDICRDKKVVKDYEKDPLILKEATLNFYVEFLLKGTKWIEKNINTYKYPCLIVHGSEDKIVPKEASQYIYDNISSEDKELKIYDGLFHEIMNEIEKDTVINDIITWLNKRL